MPYWHDSTLDHERGGYLLADSLEGRSVPKEKALVTQCRMIWAFAHVHQRGLSTPKRDYLEASELGYRFLIRQFLDSIHGGYYWSTDLAGAAVNDKKVLYGEAFAIYALVEYYRASRDKKALGHAMDLYQKLEAHAHDRKNRGWIEHFDRDWTPILKPLASTWLVEVPGLKSANAHLHLMEALTELYDETHDRGVKKSLTEALQLNMRYFYPKNPGDSCFHRHPDWKFVTDAASAGLSYGHNVEFAWLMVRAERILGRKPSWAHFYAHLDHALNSGYDHELGGLYNRGFGNTPATDTDKVWWVQAEMLAALTEAIQHRPNLDYSRALAQLLDFVQAHQVDPADGVWLDTVGRQGKVKQGGKAHAWKAAYHDGRAIVKFIEAFGQLP